MENIIKFFKKNWYYVAAVVLLIVVVVIIVRRRNKSNNGVEDPENTVAPDGLKDATYPLTPYSVAGSYSAEKGSMGTQIQFLQKLYNNNNSGGTALATDGKYGTKTLGAFKGFFGDMINANGTITEAQYDKIIEKFV